MKHRTSNVVPSLLALALGACAADAPTTPRVPSPPSEAVAARLPLAMRGEALGALRTAVSDARSRILPALGDPAAHAPLGEALATADQALAADDAVALEAALRGARAAVAAEREALGPDGAAGPELDALLLVLDGLDTAVPAPLAGRAATEAP